MTKMSLEFKEFLSPSISNNTRNPKKERSKLKAQMSCIKRITMLMFFLLQYYLIEEVNAYFEGNLY
jgi:hypothetical protein